VYHYFIMQTTTFQRSLEDKDHFTLTFELVPGRGSRTTVHAKALALARDMVMDGRICAVSITDNAGGYATLAPDVIGQEIMELGMDVISHFSCKDKNRNKMESSLYGWDRIGLCNLLVITGDYPQKGYCGHPKPVFDLDSVHVIDLLTGLNTGSASGPATSFYIGVAISPFKYHEAELAMQYLKLQRKINTGAHFGISQLGFDCRKYHELIQYRGQLAADFPILGNVFLPNLGVAKLMHGGNIPGCIMPDNLLATIKDESKSADKGKQARLERGASQLAIMRGLGYDGAHIGGPGLTMEDLNFLLTEAEQRLPRWQDLARSFSHEPSHGFYYFTSGAHTGNSVSPSPKSPKKRQSPLFHFNQFIHDQAFAEQGTLYPLAQKGCLAIEHTIFRRPLFWLENLAKSILFSCRNCGDCTLDHYGYLCPQSGCAKYLLNGPCGGSSDGWCEVYPRLKRCHYVLAYERLKSRGSVEDFGQGFTPPRDWSLQDQSSWVHFYKGIDNTHRDCRKP
jgi:methylenetetrahydrofolate reductase (NADPH)